MHQIREEWRSALATAHVVGVQLVCDDHCMGKYYSDAQAVL